MNSEQLSKLEGGARALGRLLQSAEAQTRPERFPTQGSEGLLRCLEEAPAPLRPRRAPRVAMVLAAVAFCGLSLLMFRPRGDSALGYRVEGSAQVDGARIVATHEGATRIRFSEGSAIELEPEAQLEVEATTSAGATLRVLRGAATAHIVHRGDTQWVMLAGPFWIRVVGTSFLIRWDPVLETISVKLLAGEVEVGGGSLSTGVRLRPGQRFDAASGSAEWSVRPLLPPALPSAPFDGAPRGAAPLPVAPSIGGLSTEASHVAAPPPGVREPGATAERSGFGSAVANSRVPQTRGSAAVRSTALDWPAAVARGEFERVVANAEARGVGRCLSASSPKDLQALADAARYSGKLDLAERTLLALHARSPGASPMTAYLLGSVNEARGRAAVALGWYEQCLAGAGAQGIAAEARAGQLRTLLASRGAKAAREKAREYLRDYPQGVGSSTAKRILEN